MKKQLFCMMLVCSMTSVYARRQAEAPMFERGYIKMATRGGLCGGLTLIPNPNARVRVLSQRFSESWFGPRTKPGKQLSNWVELPEGGLRVAYDWAGPRASFHYRIYCQAMNRTGSWMPVACEKVVTFEDVQHNRPCLMGPAGPSAKYAPLNMRVKRIVKQ